MWIASVEIQGFKSICEPLRLELKESDLLGIVGQNGSGKSNILDALCFALSPTTPLRVNVLSDLKNVTHQQVMNAHTRLCDMSHFCSDAL